MNKRIVIKIGPGSVDTGYTAAVQIGTEGAIPQVEIQAALPPAPDLPRLYQQWQQAYWQLGSSYRLEAAEGVTNVSVTTDIETCRTLSRQLRDRTHQWLNSNEFRPIREKLLEQLSPSDTTRILLQTKDPLLQRIPWYELEFFQRYRQAEVAVCAIDYQQVSYPGTRSKTVRILAILGNATGLDTCTDLALLNQLPNADIHILQQPNREDFNQSLWDEQGWDILFFAGHSSSHHGDGSGNDSEDVGREALKKSDRTPVCERVGNGEIMLNATESLTIPQLKHALKKAIDRGLNTAIFNSCDGLGLATDLAELYIPQVLVMREPVPDPVAHAFLKGFLESFSAGIPFFIAVREAREKLQGMEAKFPCATWLPVIVQNLAETPPTWQSLQGISTPLRPMPPLPAPTSLISLMLGVADSTQPTPVSSVDSFRTQQKHRWKVGIGTGVIIATVLLFVRQFGGLEKPELKAYDLLLQQRPTENVDSRLLIITNTNDDVANYPNTTGNGSLADETLLALLNKITPLAPQLIGLDIYRSQPATIATLASKIENTKNLIGICKAEDYTTDTGAIAPPPEITDLTRIGISDFVDDTNTGGILRRHLLAQAPPPNSPCSVYGTFSTTLALRYLTEVHDLPESDDNSFIGDTRLPFIKTESFGGYHGVDKQGTQLLLNYRILNDPTQTNCGEVIETPADCITVTDVLNSDATRLNTLINGRIVLVGTTASGYGDRWPTPYSQSPSSEDQPAGIFLQAQMVSQLLSAVIDGRPLLKSWADWQEILWIVSSALVGGLIGAYSYSHWRYRLWLRLLLAEGLLLLACWLWLSRAAVWIPWVPSAIALPAAALTTQTILKAIPQDQESTASHPIE